MQPPDSILDELGSQPARLQWIRNITVIFLSQSLKCKPCSLQAGSNDLSISSDDDNPLQGRRLRALSPPPTQRRQPLPDPLPINNETPSAQEHVVNFAAAFNNFDDYGSSPVLTEQPPRVLNAWTFDSSGFLAVPSWAYTWKDQGYRLPAHFDRISSKEHPTDVISRFLPLIIDNDSEDGPHTPSETSSTRASDDDMDIDSPPSSGRMPTSMGASSMIQEAGATPKNKDSYNVFVRGKARADDFIKLDLEKDHLPLTREQLAISTDIDSILWVTRGSNFLCRGAINLHLKPHFASHPPFSSNPSVHITLLDPPCNNTELENPQARPEKRLPLSSIPHLPFGYFGEATQQFNLYIFFPRMVHKNSNNNRAITIMPQELQELWLSEVVFKALGQSMDPYPGTSEYLPRTAEQLRLKTGGRTRQPTLPISPHALKSLLAKIRHEVSDNTNDDLLSRFGSFFFVLDARGVKILTKQHTGTENAFQALQSLVPALDWDHMLDRTHGELYLDLGVSFHPVNTPEPMVGLWRLSSLRSSYALMGHSSKNCKEYPQNTMQDYGGIKAEMSDSTKHHTHIVKRISYNLLFEAVRQPGEHAYISTLDDMIRCNQKYVDGYQRWVKILGAAGKHSYGVRDELRASAHVVTALLPIAIQRVCTLSTTSLASSRVC
jgi:hypothetical protein